MSPAARQRLSKFLSYVLRHDPAAAGVELDEAGWVGVDALLRGCEAVGYAASRDELAEVVGTSDKQRFVFSDDGARIRAQQGHSVEVELGYEPAEPPQVLYHGTIAANLASIRAEGLRRGERHHVHLSATVEMAKAVGGRRGRPVVLRVDAARMAGAGHRFFRTPNDVWLTEHVPPEYIAQ